MHINILNYNNIIMFIVAEADHCNALQSIHRRIDCELVHFVHSNFCRSSCGLPDIPSNGGVDTSAGTSFGDIARYSCDTGYTLNGLAERTCQADGQWNGSVPTCESEIDTRVAINNCDYCTCGMTYCFGCMCSCYIAGPIVIRILFLLSFVRSLL